MADSASQFIRVQADPKQLAELEKLLEGVRGGIAQASASAINKTMTTVRAVAAREIKQHVNLPVGAIKERLTILKATKQNPEGRLRISRKRIPLSKFSGVRQTKAGVTVTVRPGKRDLIKHAFLAEVKAGADDTHRGVFMRASVTGGPKRRERREDKQSTELPIRQLFGPTILGTVEKAPEIVQKTLDEAGPVLMKNLASQVDRILQRKKPDPA